MPMTIKNFILLVGMLLVATLAWAMRPTVLLADQRPAVKLATLIPQQFGEWRALPESHGQIINPQQTAILSKLYSQTLSRSYANAKGEVVMLSIAYGANQSDSLGLHYPEVCYPAQGFTVVAKQKTELTMPQGTIRATQMMTQLGNRLEPLTYWSTLGDQVVHKGTETKLAQLRYGFQGQIPDGLIFRVSSITREPAAGYALQSAFTQQLLASLTNDQRQFLAGLTPSTEPWKK